MIYWVSLRLAISLSSAADGWLLSFTQSSKGLTKAIFESTYLWTGEQFLIEHLALLV